MKLKSYKILNFLKFARKFTPPRRKRDFTPILKNFQKRTKPVIRRHVHYEYLFYKGWEKQLLAEMIYKHKEIRCTCLAWCFRRMELAKGQPLLWLSLAFYCSKVIVWELRNNVLSPRKIGFLTKRWTFILDRIMTRTHALFIVTRLKVLLLKELILEFKGKFWHNRGILVW